MVRRLPPSLTRQVIRKPRYQEKNRSEILRRCMTKLSAEHRQIIDLVYYHGKSVGDVAEIVEMPEPTVKTRMFYARKRLAALVAAA